eukprot:3114081-Rhodomonas_salina.1
MRTCCCIPGENNALTPHARGPRAGLTVSAAGALTARAFWRRSTRWCRRHWSASTALAPSRPSPSASDLPLLLLRARSQPTK